MIKTIAVANIALSHIDAGDTIRFTYKGKARLGVVEVMKSKWLVLLTSEGYRNFRYGWFHDCEQVCG